MSEDIDKKGDLRPHDLAARFRDIGYARLSEMLDTFQLHDPVPPNSGDDKIFAGRQTSSRGLMMNIALLMKMLGIDPALRPEDGKPRVIDAARLKEIVGDDDG